MRFHVAFELGYKLNSVNKQSLKEVLPNVAFIPNEVQKSNHLYEIPKTLRKHHKRNK